MLYLGLHSDRLDGGLGNHNLFGGAGADLLLLRAGGSSDFILPINLRSRRDPRIRNSFEKTNSELIGLLDLSDSLRNASSDFPNSCGTIIRWLGVRSKVVAAPERRSRSVLFAIALK